MKRKATAVWKGSGKEGSGHLSTQSSILNKTQYSFNSRFAEGTGTNPEELVAAAHSGCFSMKLSFVLGEAGFTPQELTTECTVTIRGWHCYSISIGFESQSSWNQQRKIQCLRRRRKSQLPDFKIIEYEYFIDGDFGIVSSF